MRIASFELRFVVVSGGDSLTVGDSDTMTWRHCDMAILRFCDFATKVTQTHGNTWKNRAREKGGKREKKEKETRERERERDVENGSARSE